MKKQTNLTAITKARDTAKTLTEEIRSALHQANQSDLMLEILLSDLLVDAHKILGRLDQIGITLNETEQK